MGKQLTRDEKIQFLKDAIQIYGSLRLIKAYIRNYFPPSFSTSFSTIDDSQIGVCHLFVHWYCFHNKGIRHLPTVPRLRYHFPELNQYMLKHRITPNQHIFYFYDRFQRLRVLRGMLEEMTRKRK